LLSLHHSLEQASVTMASSAKHMFLLSFLVLAWPRCASAFRTRAGDSVRRAANEQPGLDPLEASAPQNLIAPPQSLLMLEREAPPRPADRPGGAFFLWDKEHGPKPKDSPGVCSTPALQGLLVNTATEYCCNLNQFVKHCYTVLEMDYPKGWSGNRSSTGVSALLELSGHPSNEYAVVTCKLTSGGSDGTEHFNSPSSASMSSICLGAWENPDAPRVYGGTSVKSRETLPFQSLVEGPCKASLKNVGAWVRRYLTSHPEYDWQGDNCQAFSIALYNQITGSAAWPQQWLGTQVMAGIVNNVQASVGVVQSSNFGDNNVLN